MTGDMKQDILFKTDSLIFSYRVGGILIHDGSILLQKPANDGYAVIGGHVCGMETGDEALKREFMEELHVKIEIRKLTAVSEIFFPWGEKPCHQICLYYDIGLISQDIPYEGAFHGFDESGGERTDLDFIWVPLKDLENVTAFYPAELIPYLTEPHDGIVHFVSRQS